MRVKLFPNFTRHHLITHTNYIMKAKRNNMQNKNKKITYISNSGKNFQVYKEQKYNIINNPLWQNGCLK